MEFLAIGVPLAPCYSLFTGRVVSPEAVPSADRPNSFLRGKTSQLLLANYESVPCPPHRLRIARRGVVVPQPPSPSLRHTQQSADAPARLRGMQNAEQSRSDSSDASSDGTSVLFPPFLTSSGNLRIPSSLPYFPARERGQASEPQVRNSDSDDDREGEGDSPAVILGMRMLEAARQTTIQPSQNYAPDETTDNRSSALCIPPPAPLPAPTHLLELNFTACGETLLVPIHQGLWAKKSRFLSHLDANASPSPADLREGQLRIISLPIIRHSLPFRTVWPVLYQYIHVGSTAAVLQDLLTFPVPPSPLSSDPADVQQHQLGAVVARIERIRRLWLDVVALEADTDIELWDAMDRAWNVLLAELKDGLHESPPREAPPPTEGEQRTT